MNFRKLALLIALFSTNLVFSQEWIFEYESEYDNFIHKSWQSQQNSNTIHGVTLFTVPQSGKDRRSRLIELNENGDLVSYFKPKDCNTLAFYHPYGQDSIISVSRKCDGQWKNTFNIFDPSGKKVYTKEFDDKYIADRIIAHKNGITLLKTGSQHDGNFSFLELDQNNNEKEYHFPFSDFKEDNYSISATHCVKLNSGEYLLVLNIYRPYKKSTINDSYPKLLLINKEKIVWQLDYKSKLKKIETLLEIDNGYLIQGTDRENKHTIIILDKSGNHIKTFHPVSPHGSIQPDIYVFDSQLFTVSNKIYGTTILINQYDLSTGEMVNQESVDTDYWRISALQFAVVNQDYYMVTGLSVRSSKTKEQRGFVMKTLRHDTIIQETTTTQETLVNVEDLIQKTSEEILSVKVFPNPASFAIAFEVDGGISTDNMLLRIFGMDGTLISSQEFNGNHTEVEISSFPRGTYIYTVTTKEKETISGKFIAN